jgi:hypothetical protein
VGKAFVTFQYQHYAFAILDYASEFPIYVDDQIVHVKPATSPRDVNW